MMTTPESTRIAHIRRSPARSVFVAAGLMTAVLAMSGCGGNDGGDTAEPDPAAVIEDYRVAYNSGDIDGLMELFSEESVLTGHPLASESAGIDAIREVQLGDLGAGSSANAYEFSNVEVSGDTVTWDFLWTNVDGGEWCGEGHTAVVAGGQILTWAFTPDRFPCP